jgi:DNA adenine methylase
MSDELLNDLLGLAPVDEKVDRTQIERAPFGWVGGKSRSIREIIPHLPYRYKWVDHFLGSGIVTLNRKESELEICNDRFSGITSFYRVLKDKTRYKELLDYLYTTIHSREEFYHCRDTWCTEIDDVTRAAKWYYMVFHSVISKGQAFARATNSKVSNVISRNLELFPAVHQRIAKIQFENLDFETCFNDFDDHRTVHYFDPPYIGTDPGIYKHSWTDDDLMRLLNCIARAKGFCALSGYPNATIDNYLKWDHVHTWKVPVHAEVQAFTKENNKAHLKNVQEIDYAVECLWIKE